MPPGAPRKHNREQIALDMIEWAQLETSINLCGFCATQLLSPTKITDWARECDQFRAAYELTKSMLGARRERLLAEGKVHVKAYDLNAKTYDHFMKMDSREEKTFESSLRTKEETEKAMSMSDILKAAQTGQIKQE